MPILITGLNGFLGQALAHQLCDQEDIVGVGRTKDFQLAGARYFCLDITDQQAVRSLFKEFHFHTVFHFAALTSHSEIVDKKNETLGINVLGTLNLLNAFEEVGARKFIFSSTGKVYGKMTGDGLSEEESKAEPSNILGQSKLITENIIRFFANNSSSYYTICRIFNAYGPGLRESFIIPTILRQLQSSKKLLLGNLNDGRDYIYLQDLLNALMLIYKRKQEKSIDTLNIGSGRATTVQQILDNLAEIVSIDFRVETDPKKLRFDEFSEEYADISKMKALGWTPKTELREGLESCVHHFNPDLLR